MRHFSLFLLFSFFIAITGAHSQKNLTPLDSVKTIPKNAFNVKPFVPNVIPPSPEATAMNKFGDIPVGLYTGLPTIDIPIYNINYKKLRLPISLNYHASGLKVEEVASWVGLGWSLNAGGMISRTVMGLPDDAAVQTSLSGYSAGGYLNDQTPESFYQSTDILHGSSQANDRQIYDEIVVDNKRDVQPDVYNYNLPNRSGRFYINRTNKNVGVPVPTAPIQITPRYTTAGAFVGFDIKDENGLLYSFGDGSIETSQTPQSYAVTGWLLNKITSPTGEEMTFTYQSYSYALPQFKGANRFLFASGIPDDARIVGQDPPVTQYTLNTPTTSGLYISTITFPEGKVVFEASASNRQDVPTKSLSSVKVYDQVNTLIKQVDLAYGYFLEGDPLPPPIAQLISTSAYGSSTRLRLDQVQEKNGAVSLPPYLLTYNAGALPNRLSFAKDYWGYYNGKVSNADYVPKVYVGNDPTSRKFFGTADLGANDAFSKIGVLRKITYPTGGTTNLEYEANTTYTTNFNLWPANTTSPMYEYVEDDFFTGNNYSYESGNLIYGVSNSTDILGTLTLSSAKTFQFSGSVATFSYPDDINTYYPKIFFNSTTNPSIKFSFLLNQAALIQLPADTYNVQIKISVDIPSPFNTSQAGGLSATLQEVNTANLNGVLKNKKIGGLRVKRVITKDINGAETGRKVYDYSTGAGGVSSGKVQTTPSLIYSVSSTIKSLRLASIGGVTDWRAYVDLTDAFYFTSNSTIPLVYTRGQSVGYGMVTVMADETGNNGKEIHKFTTYQNYPDVLDDNAVSYPSTPSEEYDWKRGFELENTMYTASGLKVQSSTNKELIFSGSYLTGYQPACQTSTNNRDNLYSGNQDQKEQFTPDGLCKLVMLKPYKIPTGWLVNSETVERIYSQGDDTKYVETTKRFTYDNTSHYQLIAQAQSLSEGSDQELLTEYTYAGDYATGSASDQNALGVKFLVDKHMIAEPIEQTQFRQQRSSNGTVSNKRAIASTLTVYYNDKAVPRKVLKLATGSPLISFNRSAINSGGAFTYSSAYQERVLLESYDNFNNLTQQRVVDGAPTAYVWSHNGTRLAAEIKNAQFSQVQSALGGDYNSLVSGSVNEGQIRTIWDTKIRQNNQFSASLATSFTYQQLVGVSAKTDPASLTTYYVYDALSRLSQIKNNRGEIVKGYAYNYRGHLPNHPPSLTGSISNQTAVLNQAYTFTLPNNLFSDPDNQVLTYTVTNLPPGLSFSNGVISGTPLKAGDWWVSINAMDPGDLDAGVSFLITVGVGSSSCFTGDPYTIQATIYSSSTPVIIKASNRIETSPGVLVNSGASLTLKAVASVRLKTGFTVKPGASFRAYLGPCN